MVLGWERYKISSRARALDDRPGMAPALRDIPYVDYLNFRSSDAAIPVRASDARERIRPC
jgi:hypothetical protein